MDYQKFKHLNFEFASSFDIRILNFAKGAISECY